VGHTAAAQFAEDFVFADLAGCGRDHGFLPPVGGSPRSLLQILGEALTSRGRPRRRVELLRSGVGAGRRVSWFEVEMAGAVVWCGLGHASLARLRKSPVMAFALRRAA